MSNTSVVDSEAIAERIEQELARVRAARPGSQALASRVERAGNILVTHLSCRRQRVIRVRVRDGRARFLVNGSGGAVYVVNPSDWSCTCPDHHRRGAGCKHALACWALWRAGLVKPRPAAFPNWGLEHVGEIVGRTVAPMGVAGLRSCDGCGEAVPTRDLVEVGPQEAEWSLAVFEGDELCRPCASWHGVI